MLKLIFTISFLFTQGNILDTKLKIHKYEKEDYEKIFYLKNKKSITAYCIKHSNLENIKKVKYYRAGGGQETNYKVNSITFNGESIEYWDSGQVLSQIHYVDGKRNGSCRNWYKNGQLMNEGFYKNGKMNGYWVSYHENGQIQSHGSYKYTESEDYSRKDGVWKYYYDNGQLESECIIKDGVEELKFYDKKGNLIPEGGGC